MKCKVMNCQSNSASTAESGPRLLKDYRFLFSTYLIMLVIPLLICIFFNFYARSIMRQDASRYQETILSQVKSICDNTLNQAWGSVYTAAQDENTKILFTQGTWTGNTLFNVKDLVSSLSVQVSRYDCLDSLGIYFYKNDSFVTDQTRYASAIYSAYLDKYGLTAEQFIDSCQGFKGYFIITQEDRTWLVLYQNILDKHLKNYVAVAYSILSWDMLDQKLQPLDDYGNGGIFLVSEENILIGSTNPDIPSDWLPTYSELTAHQESEDVFLKADNGSLLILGTPSEELGICYGIGIAKSSFYHKINSFTYVCIIVLCLLILLGLVLAYYFTQKNSDPINHLLSIIDKNQQKYKGNSMPQSCRRLEGALFQLLSDNSTLSSQAARYDTQISEATLQGFLKGIYPSEDWILEFHEQNPNLRPIANYQVVIFCFQDVENCVFIQGHQESLESYSLLFFSLKNVIDEEFLNLNEESSRGTSLIMDNTVVCIIRAQDPSSEQELVTRANNCIDFFEKIFELKTYVAISGRHSLWTELSAAYEEAYMMTSYISFWGKDDKVGFYQTTPGSISLSRNSELQELKKKLSGSLVLNHFEEAQDIINEIITNYFPQDIQYLAYDQCQAFGLVSILLDKLCNMKIPEALEAEYSARLLHTRSIVDLQREISSIFDDILQYRSKQNSEGPAWIEQVKLYIQNNYREPNLSIAYIADHFSISASYLGDSFRKLMGIGILDYIHLMRLEECKKLLAQGETIKACAAATGYTDVKTLQRAFKRFEGITPGQYKEDKVSK